MSLVPASPAPRSVITRDGLALATYDFGEAAGLDETAPTVIAVHGFASSARANWLATGWVRELGRAGFRVVALDQRGHGASARPHESASYSMQALVADVVDVLDTYMIDDCAYVGYSLGARVGWHAALEIPERLTRLVLGGIPDGDPLTRFRVDEARAFVEHGTPVDDRLTQGYITMASGVAGNDLAALVALVGGMRGGLQPDPTDPPRQPVLFATGSDDGILAKSKALAAATPLGEFVEIPRRNHFTAPVAREFREAGVEFLTRG